MLTELTPHHLMKWVDRQFEIRPRVYITDLTRKRYGLEDDKDFVQWCRDNNLEMQPPLFPGGTYELRRQS